jgi:hypothetical protein
MKIFIPSKNRAQTINTHNLLPDATVIVHDKKQLREYRLHNPSMNLEVSNVTADAYGLTRQREWVCRHLVKKNEWFIFADDNIRSLIAVVDPFYGIEELPLSDRASKQQGALWRPRFNAICDPKRFTDVIVPDTIRYCEQVGAHLAGFAITDNIIFRKKKFSACSYVIGKLMIWHNTLEIPFDHTISMEDFYNTAMHLKHYGACVTNKFVYPRSTHYQPGGMGTYDERVPIRKKDVKELIRRFPGLLRVHNREGFAPNTDLSLVYDRAAELTRLRNRFRLV